MKLFLSWIFIPLFLFFFFVSQHYYFTGIGDYINTIKTTFHFFITKPLISINTFISIVTTRSCQLTVPLTFMVGNLKWVKKESFFLSLILLLNNIFLPPEALKSSVAKSKKSSCELLLECHVIFEWLLRIVFWFWFHCFS